MFTYACGLQSRGRDCHESLDRSDPLTCLLQTHKLWWKTAITGNPFAVDSRRVISNQNRSGPPYSTDLAPAGARSGEYGGWTSFCFPAWRASWKAHVLQTWRQFKNVWQRFCDRFLKRPLLTVSRSFMNVANSVLWKMANILKANKVNLFVSSVLFVFWNH
jgi:hypothetical protein